MRFFCKNSTTQYFANKIWGNVMRAHLRRTGVVATAILLTLQSMVAHAATPVGAIGVNVDDMKTGRLPAAGTREEADSCAAETTFTLIASLQSDKLKADDMAKVAEPMALWSKRAAGFRSMEPKAYSSDKAVADVTMSLVAIDPAIHATLEKDCIQRLSPQGTAQ